MSSDSSNLRSESGLVTSAIQAAPPITIDSFSGDGLLNGREKQVEQLISGRVSADIAVGERVDIEAFGQRWHTTVGNDRVWSVNLPSRDVSLFPAGDGVISAVVSDLEGNQRFAAKEITVQAGPGNEYSARIEINTVGDYAIRDAIVAGEDLSFTGRTYNVASGKTVTVTINDQDYTAQVQPGGFWRITLPNEDLQALPDGRVSLLASVADLTETAVTSQQLIVAHSVTEGGSLTLNPITGDNIVDANEALGWLKVNGTSEGITTGNTVEVVINDIYHYALIQEDGTWEVTLTQSEVQSLNEGDNYAYVNTYDEFYRYSSDIADFIVDRFPPYQPITIDDVSGDSNFNGREKRVDQVISGMLDEIDNDWLQLTVMLNGKSYNATITSEGAWSAVIPSADMLALPEGNVLLRAQALSESGDIYTNNKVIDVTAGLGNNYSARVTLDPLADDSVLNALENYQDLLISGRAYNAASGKIVTVTLNGEHYTTQVQDGGYWNLNISRIDLHDLKLGSATLLASLADLGETATSVQIINVDKPQPQITIDPFTGDNVLSYAESQVYQLITGTSQHIQRGQTITVKLGEKEYSTVTSSDDDWSIVFPAADLQALTNNSELIEVRVTTEWEQDVSASELVQIQAPPRSSITMSPISEDQILTPEEALSPLTISGTLQGTFSPGSEIEMIIGESMYYTIPEGSAWSFTLTPADLARLEEGSNTVYVRTNDAFGREVTAVQSLLVDKADTADALTLDTLGMQASYEQDIMQLLANENQEAELSQASITMPMEAQISLAEAVSEIWDPVTQDRASGSSNLPVIENTLAEFLVQHNLDTRIV
ncbi:hypothetical protein [Pantoea sp. FN0305]|uniref:hypothetical protein n=1 Tax=Pantoea sp. FN0305 TaxID=3418559 RepID=UPI003CED21D0